MPLKELEQLTDELEALKEMLRSEGRQETRCWLYQRAHEIVQKIERPYQREDRHDQ